MNQHRLDVINKDNKYGQYSNRHNIDTIKRHKQNHDLVQVITKALQESTEKSEHSMKLKQILSEIVEKYSEPCDENKEDNVEDDLILDFSEIYNNKAVEKVKPIDTKKDVVPKMKAIVDLAVSKAKLDKIINNKKW